jgi:tetratricopeptide (TPR) repeat protein
MTLSVRQCSHLCLLLSAIFLGGCFPTSQSQSDEEKEDYFQAGKRRVAAMDYKGAIESFEKALEVNPRSSAAHYQLGWLFDRKASNPAAAIYHYERYLLLKANATEAENIKDQIFACKQELARTVFLGPLTEKQQRDIEKTLEDNNRLRDENKKLSDELNKLRNLPATASQTNGAIATLSSRTAPGSSQSSAPPRSNLPARTHTVKAGETPASIAKQYAVKLDALLSANPRLDPRRMRPGQTLVIP